MYGLLVPTGGGEPLPLLKTTVMVGRHADCDVVIAAPSVSARHCRLEFVNGVWRVSDLDSRNGTGINGRRCRRARIMPGQILNVAKCRFHIDYSRPDGQPSGDDDLALQFLRESNPECQTESGGIGGQTSEDAVNIDVSMSPGPGRGVSNGPLGMLLPAGGGVPLPLHADNLVLGRSRSCDLRITTGTVSSKHCRLQLINGYWVVEDLDSSNGVRVDGIRYRRKCVMPGAELSLSRESFILDYVPGDGAPPVIHEPHGVSSSRRAGPRGSLLERAGLSARDVAAIREDDNAVPKRTTYSLDDDEL